MHAYKLLTNDFQYIYNILCLCMYRICIIVKLYIHTHTHIYIYIYIYIHTYIYMIVLYVYMLCTIILYYITLFFLFAPKLYYYAKCIAIIRLLYFMYCGITVCQLHPYSTFNVSFLVVYLTVFVEEVGGYNICSNNSNIYI